MAVDVSALFGSFDPLGAYQKGAQIKKGWETDAALKDTFSNMPVGPDGKPDFMTAAQKLFAVGATGPGLGLAQLAQAQADKEAARNQFQQTFGLQQQQFAQSQKNADRTYGLQVRTAERQDINTPEGREEAAKKAGLRPGTPEFNQYVLGGKVPGPNKLSATEMKLVSEADDEAKSIENTLPLLKEAFELSKKAFFGPGAGVRGTIGTQFPTIAKNDPTGFIDPASAQATVRYQQIMAPEAITQMAASLKGATTDFELREFTRMMADPAVAPELKQAKLTDILNKAQSRMNFLRSQAAEVRGQTYFKPPSSPGQAPATQQPAQPPQYKEGQKARNPQTGETRVFRGGQWVAE